MYSSSASQKSLKRKPKSKKILLLLLLIYIILVKHENLVTYPFKVNFIGIELPIFEFL